MPKLKKRGGGINTGASVDSSYSSDPESNRSSAPRPPIGSAPAPPAPPGGSAPSMPKVNGLRPTPQSIESSPPFSNPLVANLRRPPPKPAPRPSSSVSVPVSKPPPPPPPPVTLRKPSSAFQPPAPPPPPPLSASPSRSAAPPPPPSSAPSLPPSRSTPPPPSSAPAPSTPLHGLQNSVAMQAARNAFSTQRLSPSTAPPPPPPPPTSPPVAPPPPPASAPSPPLSRPSPHSQPVGRSNLDPSMYTPSNGGSGSPGRTPTKSTLYIDDRRWKFQDESQLPPPRQFVGGPKQYRAGRGSSVPLDLQGLL